MHQSWSSEETKEELTRLYAAGNGTHTYTDHYHFITLQVVVDNPPEGSYSDLMVL